ncbi:hypothetical protein GKZ89_01585 [Bacillus mangrovi]|uniref:Protein-L-IsoD(D-D) O-methyltransferase n=1 Tax=Metabacillus mangrovi TaxID=1491830 RepID=A0A7X2V368_9BACI|nr:hypothetical protein [Metabacillus mangrovi]
MIITTVMKNQKAVEGAARELAAQLNSPFLLRDRQSVSSMLQKGEPVLIMGVDRMELFTDEQASPFYFHPNSSMFRVKRLLAGQSDPFIAAADLKEGSSLLDCTMGLASDSITAAFAAGEGGKVTAIEGSREMALIVKHGLKKWDTGIDAMNRAMARVEVQHADHLTYLKSCGDASFDTVYFDPMFEEAVSSEGIEPLKKLAVYSGLTDEVIAEARRVAKGRVVLKDHWKSSRFDRWGFQQIKRRSSSFHYGVLETGN